MEPNHFITRGRIFAIGRGANIELIRKFRNLTGKTHPRICYLPTASGDHPDLIAWWENLGIELDFEPVVQKLFISSFDQQEAFGDVLLRCDAIYVGGGNTVNMLAIWKAHGIDEILRQALQQNILLGGGSAGGICWFEGGLTDSRPKILTPMTALGWLPGSFAPHYLSEPGRRAYFHKYILDGSLPDSNADDNHKEEAGLPDGYGCDDTAALYFVDGKFTAAYGSSPDAKAFAVKKVGEKIVEEEIYVL